MKFKNLHVDATGPEAELEHAAEVGVPQAPCPSTKRRGLRAWSVPGFDSSGPARCADRRTSRIGRADVKPAYPMWIEWHGGRIVFIHDHRHARHLVDDAERVLAPAATCP